MAERPKPLRMTLDPPELGTLAIEIVERAGRVEVRIDADLAATEKLLREHLDPIRELAAKAMPQFEAGSGGVDVHVGGGSDRDTDEDTPSGDASDQRTDGPEPQRRPSLRRSAGRLDVQA